MTRLKTDDLVPARPEGEGLVKLRRRPSREEALKLAEEWPGQSHLLHRCRPRLVREWSMVNSDLRRVLRELAATKLPWPLYLWGPVGGGKTRAALAFCDLTVMARYWTVDDVMEMVVAHWPPWHQWGIVELAVLDELGLPRPGNADEFDYSVVKQFLDWRECRPAIYISNLDPKRIHDHYDQRIASRLTAGTVYPLKDRDRRQRE